ncbi:glycosyltransferase [Aliidongia dinghuensis]|uniref:glycosyltransferase n=1 Tax=Aliidongia dinghuensis TaxID=1867774 RepID=UPI001E3927BD|nr:glycosyltransferase [Aliidongia dinghuensis]
MNEEDAIVVRAEDGTAREASNASAPALRLVEPRPKTLRAAALERVRVEGKFFFTGDAKFFLKGVTYGPFPVGADGTQFPPAERVRQDMALMAEAGVNTLRVFTVPPVWLLDIAAEHGLRVLAGIPWSQHITFLDSEATKAEIRRMVMAGVRSLGRHPALLAYMIGNEIPPDMIRWHGPDKVRAFLVDLVKEVKAYDPTGLVSYANFPSTEYLTVDFTDFLCFNVYLHNESAFRRYIARLHNLAVDRPLVLTEFGMDSMREGKDHQAETIGWQVRTAFELGCAGTCVFAWTDEWFTGGHLIEDWEFGIVDRDRRKKPAFEAVAANYQGPLPPALPHYPRVSVVVCAYNADRTMDQCLASLEHLNYPDYEVIVVNDGSTDRTLEISQRYDYCKIISQPNKGLSVARNVGAEMATGEIVAYTDSDCVADKDWLTYLVAKMQHKGLAAVGGPNFPPPEDDLVPAAVAVSPGGPTHVLVSDEVAEHIAGCNMAFRRDVLLQLGGFDPVYRAAGDDVDICWRFQNAGYTIGFAPAAVVWHFRRNTVEAYLNQQKGYGKAEALVYSKHPLRFNLFGQAKWLGRIYGDLSASLLLSRRPVIYSGVFGRGLFQTMYEPPSSLAAFLPLTFEWNIVAIVLAFAGLVAGGWWLLLWVPLLTTWAMCVSGALKAPIDPRFRSLKARALIACLIYLGPILRGWTRIKWRVKESNAADTLPGEADGPLAPAKIDWRNRALFFSYWGQNYEEKEVLLAGLMEFLIPRKYFLQTDEGWSDWDLKIARGLWSRAFVMAVTENHGGEKRVLRVRCAMRLSRLASFVLRCYAGATAAALVVGLPVPAFLIAAAGLANFGYIADQTWRFGRIMNRVIDEVARKAKLTPMTGRKAG